MSLFIWYSLSTACDDWKSRYLIFTHYLHKIAGKSSLLGGCNLMWRYGVCLFGFVSWGQKSWKWIYVFHRISNQLNLIWSGRWRPHWSSPTPRKFNIDPKNRPSEKETHLPFPSFFRGELLNFQGVICGQDFNASWQDLTFEKLSEVFGWRHFWLVWWWS